MRTARIFLVTVVSLAGCRTVTDSALRTAPDQSQCPVSGCAAPPDGCSYDGHAALDAQGCPVGCGGLICGSPGNVACSPPPCAAPPPGCQRKVVEDAKGCAVGCGTLTCSPA